MLFIYFQGKIKFWHCIWSIWLFWIYFLKWNRYFSACERLPNSSCHFWKHKSVFLQIFHHSSVPSSPLHIFWNFWVLGSKFVKLLMSILNWQVSFFSNFASFFSVITHNSSVTFKLMHFLLLTKGSHQSPNFDTSNCCGEIAKLLMSFSKQQVSFSSNFAWQCHEK